MDYGFYVKLMWTLRNLLLLQNANQPSQYIVDETLLIIARDKVGSKLFAL
jgi:hypothetical protein